MKEPRRIEREFGVPIAGEILPPERWTQTALKKLPAGHINWRELFGREAPVVLDLGCGNGRFLIGSAVWRPTHDHLGLDVLPVVIRYATRRGNQRGLTNLRFAVGGAKEFLQRHVPPHSVAEIHCYHPQPQPRPRGEKRSEGTEREVSRRLITPEFLALVHRALIPGRLFFIQTDNPGYWRYMTELLRMFFDFHEQAGTWPDAPKGRTRREIIALRRGLPVLRGWGTSRQGLSETEALRLAGSLPAPIFQPDRRLQELDDLEQRHS